MLMTKQKTGTIDNTIMHTPFKITPQWSKIIIRAECSTSITATTMLDNTTVTQTASKAQTTAQTQKKDNLFFGTSKTPKLNGKESANAWPSTSAIETNPHHTEQPNKLSKKLSLPQNTVKIMSWNVRTLTIEKLKFITGKNPDIIALQELGNNKINEIASDEYNYIENLRIKRRGGGVAVLWRKKIKASIIEALKEDMMALKFTVNRGQSFILICAYLPPSNKMQQLEELEKEINKIKSSFKSIRIIIAGDFNINLCKTGHNQTTLKNKLSEFIDPRCKYEHMSYQIQEYQSRLDYILDNKHKREDTHIVDYNLNLSYHYILGKVISGIDEPKRNYVKILDKEKLAELTKKITQLEAEPLKYLMENHEYIKNKVYKNVKRTNSITRITHKMVNLETELWKYINRSLARNRKETKVFYLITHLTRSMYSNPTKITKLKTDNCIISDPTTISSTIADWYKHTHTHQDDNYTLSTKEELLNCKESLMITGDDLIKAAQKIKKKKAIAADLITDSYIDQIIEGNAMVIDVLVQALNKPTASSLKKLEFYMQGRLIPVRKTNSEITDIKDIRPIIIPSRVFKLVENLMKNSITAASAATIEKCQTGFIEKLSITINLRRLIKEAKLRRHDGRESYVLFIDLKSAYDRVRRKSISHALNALCDNQNSSK